jgi:hypothetical protein
LHNKTATEKSTLFSDFCSAKIGEKGKKKKNKHKQFNIHEMNMIAPTQTADKEIVSQNHDKS